MAKAQGATSGFLSLPSSRPGRVGGCLVAVGVGGVAAVVGRRDRSWVLAVAIVLLVQVVVMMGWDLLGPSE